jgi:hypothetical protein
VILEKDEERERTAPEVDERRRKEDQKIRRSKGV